MSATTLTLWLQSFMNNFANLLHNSSSIDEMLHVAPQQYYQNMTLLKFSLIWMWESHFGREFVGHSGEVPGMSNVMYTNEKRNLGVIILTNADEIRSDSQSMQVGQTIGQLMGQFFDCFEKKI